MASREWIEAAVEAYEGNLLFVSHDRYFINRFATRIWMLENGRITDFDGTYQQFQAARERAGTNRDGKAAPSPLPKEEPKPQKKRSGGTKELEKQVAAGGAGGGPRRRNGQYELVQKAEEVALNYLELQKVYDEQKALEEEIAALYTNWERLAAELEEAQA